ncbi:MAG: lantibiotic dehydratase family protein [Bacteroidetes bacterium]|nr:lantibiotic dehydratase family protein [Bacteroidota bacterium]
MDRPQYRIADTFLLRAPLLSLKVLEEISSTGDLDLVLRNYYDIPVISESLYLASPVLFNLSEQWLNHADEKIKDPARLRHTLLKYLIRMACRSTPFGLFAGISSGCFGDRTDIRISPPGKHQLHVRPDMQYLCTLAAHLGSDADVREKLEYSPNTSLGEIGDDFRYIEYTSDEDGIRKYKLQSTAGSSSLKMILEMASAGAGIAELTRSLLSEEIDEEEARTYIHTLIDNQVLVSDLEPVVTGNGFHEALLNRLNGSPAGHKLLTHLKLLWDQLQDLKINGNAHRIEVFKSIRESAAASGIPYKDEWLLQADLQLNPESCILKDQIRKDLQSVLPVLMKLSRPHKNPFLEKFKEAFIRRYDMQEVPLLLALDPEAGLAYLPDDQHANASPLLDGLRIPGTKGHTTDMRWHAVDQMLYRKLQETLISGTDEIEIGPKDIESLPDSELKFPASFSALVKIPGKWKKNTARDIIQIESAGGSSAANLAGRFCYIDEGLHQTIRNIADIEKEIAGDHILAEIVHLPQQRTGNVLMRPVLREYEIPFLGRSSVDSDFAIPVSDLMVSIRNNMVVLRSKRLNKYILPHLSNAHNFSFGALSIYTFLCDMQSQNIMTNLGFSWGPLESETLYLPRVSYKNIVLQSASWNLKDDILAPVQRAGNDDELLSAVAGIRAKYSMPRQLTLTESDNELWLDMENISCLRLLKREIKNRKVVSFREFLFDSKEGIVSGENGIMANEFVFFFHQTPADKHEA